MFTEVYSRYFLEGILQFLLSLYACSGRMSVFCIYLSQNSVKHVADAQIILGISPGSKIYNSQRGESYSDQRLQIQKIMAPGWIT